VTGSDLGEQFILGGGSDTLDAGGGHDVVRYDRDGIDGGVSVNLAAGTATGTWNGEAFSHTLSNVEQVRGTKEGDDTLTASDSGSHLRGNGGDDSLVGGAGDDLLDGGDGEDTFVVGLGNDTIRGYVDADDQVEFSPELTPEQTDTMIAAAQQDGDDVILTLPNSATVRIENWTVAELQASHAGGGSGGDTNPINGTSGDDTLTGTAGNDAIDPMGNDGGDDLIIGSSGNDTIDLSNSGGESFVSLDYKALDAPISAVLDYTKNLGTVDKGANGTDTLTSPETTAEAAGLSLTGTSGNDSFNVVQGTDSTWTKIGVQGGDDTVTAVLNQGTVRLTTADEDVTANLATGTISFTGGSVDLDVTGPVDGSGRIELETGDGDDTITGSDLNERFILGSGTDSLDAGGGHDVVRYDRNGIDGGVSVNLATGTATGTWNGEAFTHTLTNVEEVRGTKEGDDTLTASDSGSTLRGRGGDDSLVGGDGADVFIVGEGHDTISNYDFEADQIETNDGVLDGTLPEYSEVTVDGSPAVRFELGADKSVTVAGISEKGFENLIVAQTLSLSPGSMTDPVTMTISGSGDYALFIREATSNLVTDTPTELAFEHTLPEGTYRFSILGEGLSISGEEGSEVYAGTVASASLTLAGGEVLSMENLGIPLTDFAAMIDSIQDNGNFDAGLGLGDRDLILVANDVEQTIFVSGVDQWIEVNGSGADTVSFDGGGNAAIILGDGDDTVNISASTPSEDRAFIYIDAESTGVKAINGFRFTNDPETGDRLVIEDTRGDFSIARLVDDIDDQDALNTIADEFASHGQGEYALFYESSGDAVLLEFASGNTLGDTVATFTNADVSGFDGSNIDGYMKFLDIELPAASELV
jgi:Ca2+-binding RTX toxin-like protein